LIKYLKIKPLGLLVYNSVLVNHRSLLKVLINPILRCFGFYIGSIFYNNTFIKYRVYKSNELKINIFKNYYNSLFTCNEYTQIKKVNKG
jgi:hypothetical protein